MGYGLYEFLGDETIDRLPELIVGVLIGFKLYMGETFRKNPAPYTGAMLEVFKVVMPTGSLMAASAKERGRHVQSRTDAGPRLR